LYTEIFTSAAGKTEDDLKITSPSGKTLGRRRHCQNLRRTIIHGENSSSRSTMTHLDTTKIIVLAILAHSQEEERIPGQLRQFATKFILAFQG
jgi:hypothetical protein